VDRFERRTVDSDSVSTAWASGRAKTQIAFCINSVLCPRNYPELPCPYSQPIGMDIKACRRARSIKRRGWD
jgi:hypothetical protein